MRGRGYTYGGTPVRTGLFYGMSIVLTVLVFAPMSFGWHFFNPLHALILAVLYVGISYGDWKITQRYPEKDRAWVWNSTRVKYTDILFQQLVIFLFFVSITFYCESILSQVALFAVIFSILHLPVFLVMPKTIAWVFFLASVFAGVLFPLLFIFLPHLGPYITIVLHILFYSALRILRHDSDVWAQFIEKD